MARINENTYGSGCYANKTYGMVKQEVRRFEGWGGFFTKALYTILHRIDGVKIGKTSFPAMGSESTRGPMRKFVRHLFENAIDYESALIMIAAVKAYVMASEKRASVYWKVEAGGGIVKRDLKWVNLTPMKSLDAATEEKVKQFKEDLFYKRLVRWMEEGKGRKPIIGYPDWVRLYDGNAFYHEVVAWMDAKGMLEYEVVEDPKPPVIAPPVIPVPVPVPAPVAQGPAQRDLFGWTPPKNMKE